MPMARLTIQGMTHKCGLESEQAPVGGGLSTMMPSYIGRTLVVGGVSEANPDGRWSNVPASTAANRVLVFSFLHLGCRSLGSGVRA
jgi:hypothetical protein